ncbi:MAG: transglutaminase family protein [Methylobacteriaceae bacterium]|nr:transglutaminase family protein [Methylobacteriaceae bacterium]MBV9637354.1 transglutaminase family protein [Methylobacteriaceae bacterium]
MRIGIHHEIRFGFDAPVKSLVQSLRLTPRNHEGQHIASWRMDVDADCRLKASEDAFGNLTHVLNCDGPIDSLTVLVAGEVETFDTAGVLRGTVERFPPELFLRETPVTAADAAVRAFADDAAAALLDPLDQMHALLARLHHRVALASSPPEDPMPGQDVLRGPHGTAVGLAHLFIAAARHLAVPARFVAGYVPTAEGEPGEPDAPAQTLVLPAHAWAEVYIGRLGWVGFDPATGLCPQETYVRIAAGLDHLGAAPIRIAQHGAAADTVETRIRVTSSEPQAQL